VQTDEALDFGEELLRLVRDGYALGESFGLPLEGVDLVHAVPQALVDELDGLGCQRVEIRPEELAEQLPGRDVLRERVGIALLVFVTSRKGEQERHEAAVVQQQGGERRARRYVRDAQEVGALSRHPEPLEIGEQLGGVRGGAPASCVGELGRPCGGHLARVGSLLGSMESSCGKPG
jgi:hypothetical protein